MNKKEQAEFEDLKKQSEINLRKYEKIVKNFEEYKNSNVVQIDVSNEDNMKTVRQLMYEGKILSDAKTKKPFILAQQYGPMYHSNLPVIHKIFIDDIKDIVITTYYKDLEVQQDPSKRTVIRTVIWCRHNGYNIESTLTSDNLKYLLDNNLISKSMIHYTDVDCVSGNSYYNTKHMNIKDVLSTKEKVDKVYSDLGKGYSIDIEGELNRNDNFSEVTNESKENKEESKNIKNTVSVENVTEPIETRPEEQVEQSTDVEENISDFEEDDQDLLSGLDLDNLDLSL